MISWDDSESVTNWRRNMSEAEENAELGADSLDAWSSAAITAKATLLLVLAIVGAIINVWSVRILSSEESPPTSIPSKKSNPAVTTLLIALATAVTVSNGFNVLHYGLTG